MQFYFIRHAQSYNNALWMRTGSSKGRVMDPPLTDVGHQQARRLGRFLARHGSPGTVNGYDLQNANGFGLTHLYCSFMERAIATASAIAKEADIPLCAWETCFEEGGIYLDDENTGEPVGQPGPGRSHFQKQYPHLALPDTLSDDGWYNRPFEAHEERLPRARRFVAELLERHGGTDDHVAVVSHGGFYTLVIRVLLGLDGEPDDEPRPYRLWFSMNNTAITRIDFFEDEISIAYQNRLDFLPPHLVS